MQDKNNESMDDIEFDVLTEIGNIGAGNATTALSQLINARIDMRVPKVELLTFAELAEVIGGAETLVQAFYFLWKVIFRAQCYLYWKVMQQDY